MCKYLYYMLITSKLGKVNLFDVLGTARKYKKLLANNNSNFQPYHGTSNIFCLQDNEENEPVFIHVDADIETDCIFYKDLFFTLSYDDETKDCVVRGYVKSPDDVWMFEMNRSGSGCNVLNPLTTCAEVYNAYDVNVLKLTRCRGENYVTGTWNKAFYKTLCSLVEKVDGLTEISQMNKIYKKTKTKKNDGRNSQ